MGAPLAWAGLSKIVMVVAVSFKKASVPSYSSKVGAVKRAHHCNHASKKHFSSHVLLQNKIKKTPYLPEIFVVTLSMVPGPKPLEVDALIESWYVTPGWSRENR